MELRHGLTVLGDHQHLAGGGHLIHQAQTAGLELRGADRGGHDTQTKDADHPNGLMTMVMTMILA
jgi:hypothetical protein